MMKTGRVNHKKSSHGQVLLLGVAVLIVLLLAALLLFDLHNGMRAKIKVETAQQAAALAGAQWQVAGLNMLGELNIAKACTLMLDEDSVIEATPFVPTPEQKKFTKEELEKEEKRHRLHSRMRTLNEAQARVTFILPLLGYAAVQQTAKQNGMNDEEPAVRHYYEEVLPLSDHKEKHYHGYFWYEPYRRLLGEIVDQRAVIRCNARVAELPEVWSNPEGSRFIHGGGESSFALLLSEESLYDAISNKNFCHWQLINIAKKGVYLTSPWWKITYIPGVFIEESEILPLGVRYSGGSSVPELLQKGYLNGLSGPTDWNLDEEFQPDTWCIYDQKWYSTAWTMEAYESQQTNWRGGRWLRNDRLPGFLYEGAVTAVDCAIGSNRVLTFRVKPQKTAQEGGRMEIREPLENKYSTHVTVGRTSTQRGVNLGVVAKVFGGFHDLRSVDDAPIATPVILPVFSRGLLIPSAMPYSVTMLTKGDHDLKRFLQWLATWPDIDRESPPEGTAWYLEQLRKLMDPDFILSIYNRDFPGLHTLDFMDLMEENYLYPARSDGAGWLQQAYRVFTPRCPQKVVYTGKRFKCGDCDVCKYQATWIKKKMDKSSCGTWETTLEPAVPDNEPTELPQTYVDEKGVARRYFRDYDGISRIYYGNAESGYWYCCRKNGKIQNNEDIACNSHQYVPPGGGMNLGIESGPTRL